MPNAFTADRPIRWGILGPGRIAQRFAASLVQAEGCELAAVAGRSPEKVEAFGEAFNIPAAKRYAGTAAGNGSMAYEALVNDPEIDVVYISLPHGMHAEWACRALEAGKAVLSEKPAGVSEEEARRICDTARANGRLYVEGMKCRFAPLHEHLRRLILSGNLGAVTGIESIQRLDYGKEPPAYLLDLQQGGSLLDMGCYAVSWVEELAFGSIDIENVDVTWRDATQTGARVDWADDIRMKIDEVPVRIFVDGGAAEYEQRLEIQCERGSITVERQHRPEHAVVHRPEFGDEAIDEPYEVDDFYDEIMNFAACLRAGAQESPLMPHASTVRCANIMDSIRARYR